MITSAAKYDLADSFFHREIQQLGLPNEHADIIASLYRQSKDDLRLISCDNSFRVSKLISTDWRVDQIFECSESSDIQSPYLIHFKMEIEENLHKGTKEFSSVLFTANRAKLDLLVHELSSAKSMMDNIGM